MDLQKSCWVLDGGLATEIENKGFHIQVCDSLSHFQDWSMPYPFLPPPPTEWPPVECTPAAHTPSTDCRDPQELPRAGRWHHHHCLLPGVIWEHRLYLIPVSFSNDCSQPASMCTASDQEGWQGMRLVVSTCPLSNMLFRPCNISGQGWFTWVATIIC